MTEYKVDDKVWVKATIREVDVDTLRIELPGAANKWVTRWDARPRADAAPDVAALRAACEMALGFLNANLSQRIQTHSLVFSALRAALAAAPKAETFEGVRVGDTVTVGNWGPQEAVLETCSCGEFSKVGNEAASAWVPTKVLVIIRPEPPEPSKTCGGCRWWDENNRHDSCRQHYPWKRNPGKSEPACGHFEQYQKS